MRKNTSPAAMKNELLFTYFIYTRNKALKAENSFLLFTV